MDEEKKLLLSSDANPEACYLSISQSSDSSKKSDQRSTERIKRMESFVVEPVTLSFENINVRTLSKKKFYQKASSVKPVKQILRNVSGVVRPGTLIAIMGASGAGKSTLMNVFTRRNVKQLKVEGNVKINGVTVGDGIRNISAYVQQDDLFIGTLTVREHLTFRALLRMDRAIKRKKRLERVEQVLQELGLTKCADTTIGVQGRLKGISGGESKRLSFAAEILTNPPLLFCDEPTSGIDSYMALNIIQTVKQMARNGRTVLCTIHQPSSEIFDAFNDVLLLAEGRVAFMGPTTAATEFFNSHGYICPTNFNPADHYISTLAIIPGREQECRTKVEAICDRFDASPQAKLMKADVAEPGESTKQWLLEETAGSDSRYSTSWCTQFRSVFWRSWVNHFREPMVFKIRLIQSVIIALMLSLIYLRQDYDQKGVQNINGILFLVIINMSMTQVFAVANVFPKEVPIFLREYGTRLYSISVYYLCKMIAELPSFILFPLVFISITYWMTGLYESLDAFLVCSALVTLIANVALSFGYLISTLCPTVDIALAAAPPIMVPLMLFGGFFMNSGSVPVYFVWLNYLSWFSYSNEVLSINQWQHVDHLDCDVKPVSNCSRCIPDGKAVLEQLNYHETIAYDPSEERARSNEKAKDMDNYYLDIGLLFALLVGFRILAFIALWVRTKLSSE